MLKTVRMVTEAPHEYGGKWLAVGEEFEAEDGHVALLLALGRASVKKDLGYDTRQMAARTFNHKRRDAKKAH